MIKNKNVSLGATMIVLSSVFYGSYGIWTRLMGDDFGPFMQTWIRSIMVCLIMIPFVLRTKEGWQPIRWKQDRRWLAYGAFSTLIIGGPLYYSINKIGIGLATLIMYAGYLLSMFLLGKLFNGEKYSSEKLIATCLAMIGLLLVFLPSTHSHGVSIVACFASLIAGAGIGLDLTVSQNINYNSAQSAIIAWGGGIILNLPIAFLLHEKTPGFHHPLTWLYASLFVIASVGASWSSIHGVKLMEAGAAAILGLLEIVWAIIFGVLLFHERPALLAYIGAIFIIAAATIPYTRSIRQKSLIEEVPA